ncbi:D-hexose-6-phosphate mutarotase [Marinobacter hydrocarbonoclasticus]|nr:D-hexose-6-phosphate mutarotase [Marinobacter nauticus]
MSPLSLRCADSVLTVSPFGAQALSWTSKGADRLWLSQTADLSGRLPIRGGVPLCFPWFGKKPDGPSHGFARTEHWQVVEQVESGKQALLTLELSDSERTRAVWPHRFRARMQFVLRADQLAMALTITNTDHHAWSFTGALHGYFATEVAGLNLPELAGLPHIDKLAKSESLFDDGPGAPLPPIPVDAIVPGLTTLRLPQGASWLHLENRGHDATVVWNPGPNPGIGDLHPGGEAQFLCLESAWVLEPKVLKPGESHTLGQRLTVTG